LTFGALTDRDERRSELFRWTLCATFVLAVHGLAIVLLHPKSDDIDEAAGAPIAFIELAPIPVGPPAPPSDLAPGPLQPEAEASDSLPQPQVEEPRQPPVEEPPLPEETATADPEPVRTPPIEAAQEPPPSDVSIPTAPPSVAEPAAEPASPALGRLAEPSSARVASWERSLVAQIERFKRYPPQAEGRFGIVRVAFSIDRSGRLLGARIISSSGSAILDDEALAIIRRAAPFPGPPTGVADDRLSFVLPIRYAPSGQR
jgi:protein TonB